MNMACSVGTSHKSSATKFGPVSGSQQQHLLSLALQARLAQELGDDAEGRVPAASLNQLRQLLVRLREHRAALEAAGEAASLQGAASGPGDYCCAVLMYHGSSPEHPSGLGEQ